MYGGDVRPLLFACRLITVVHCEERTREWCLKRVRNSLVACDWDVVGEGGVDCVVPLSNVTIKAL